MNKIYFFLFALFFCFKLQAATYPEVLFDNSLMPKSYYFSQSHFDGASWINHMNGHLPVSDSVFFTPGNALLLNYISSDHGSWSTAVHYNNDTGYLAKNNDILVFKLFATNGTPAAALPMIQLKQGEHISDSISLSPYLNNYQENTWISISIPLTAITQLDPHAPISSIVFKQGKADDKEHRVFIDQIEFLPKEMPAMKLTGKAVLSSIDAYERHVDIAWQLPLTPSIRYIKIYRSEDGEDFYPVAMRPISYNRYTDFVPRTNVRYYYKIAWVDYQYRESPFSDVKQAETKLASDDELLNAVEKSHIAYFTDEAEFNSGMHKVSPLVSDAKVSVRATGIGILTQIIGVERKFVSRQLLLDRLNKTVSFLEKATTYHGAYPELLNGRTGKPILTDSCGIAANLESTAYLMQGLLVARNYFNGDEPAEKSLRDKITKLWRAVRWDFFIPSEQGHHLYDSWSPACHFDQAKPIGGYNGGFVAYLLGMISPNHAVPASVYAQGFKQPLSYVGPAIGRFSTALTDTLIMNNDTQQATLYSKQPFLVDTVYYGVSVKASDTTASLIRLQQPFLAFDPKTVIDTQINYYNNQQHLSRVFYRAALNKGEQFVSLTDILWPSVGKDSLAINRYNPSAAIATYPYTPVIAMEALKNYYRTLGKYLWTEYGFRDEFSFRENWVSGSFDPIHQGIVPIMLENARTGLIWNLFMKDEDVAKFVQHAH